MSRPSHSAPVAQASPGGGSRWKHVAAKAKAVTRLTAGARNGRRSPTSPRSLGSPRSPRSLRRECPKVDCVSVRTRYGKLKTRFTELKRAYTQTLTSLKMGNQQNEVLKAKNEKHLREIEELRSDLARVKMWNERIRERRRGWESLTSSDVRPQLETVAEVGWRSDLIESTVAGIELEKKKRKAVVSLAQDSVADLETKLNIATSDAQFWKASYERERRHRNDLTRQLFGCVLPSLTECVSGSLDDDEAMEVKRKSFAPVVQRLAEHVHQSSVSGATRLKSLEEEITKLEGLDQELAEGLQTSRTRQSEFESQISGLQVEAARLRMEALKSWREQQSAIADGESETVDATVYEKLRLAASEKEKEAATCEIQVQKHQNEALAFSRKRSELRVRLTRLQSKSVSLREDIAAVGVELQCATPDSLATGSLWGRREGTFGVGARWPFVVVNRPDEEFRRIYHSFFEKELQSIPQVIGFVVDLTTGPTFLFEHFDKTLLDLLSERPLGVGEKILMMLQCATVVRSIHDLDLAHGEISLERFVVKESEVDGYHALLGWVRKDPLVVDPATKEVDSDDLAMMRSKDVFQLGIVCLRIALWPRTLKNCLSEEVAAFHADFPKSSIFQRLGGDNVSSAVFPLGVIAHLQESLRMNPEARPSSVDFVQSLEEGIRNVPAQPVDDSPVSDARVEALCKEVESRHSDVRAVLGNHSAEVPVSRVASDIGRIISDRQDRLTGLRQRLRQMCGIDESPSEPSEPSEPSDPSDPSDPSEESVSVSVSVPSPVTEVVVSRSEDAE